MRFSLLLAVLFAVLPLVGAQAAQPLTSSVKPKAVTNLLLTKMGARDDDDPVCQAGSYYVGDYQCCPDGDYYVGYGLCCPAGTNYDTSTGDCDY
jgi:hypothetical protein